MSSPRVRYDESPMFVLNYPSCSACSVDLEHDGDGWECPKCGTSWDSNASDGDKGELWPEWSGESYDDNLPVTSHDDGHKVPWIEHQYVPWLTSGGYDMRKCHKCFEVPSMHVGGAA